jgi:type VI secretion system secreted protein Hcp
MRGKVLAVGALVAGLLAGGVGQAFAMTRTFMMVPGIEGSATDSRHLGWIEVLSMSQGASSTKKSLVCSDLSVLKVTDQAGPALWGAAAIGQLFQEIHIEVVSGSADGEPFVVYDIRLGNAKVTSINTSSSSELPVESVSFSYQDLTLTFNRQADDGTLIPGTPQTIACH